VRPLEVGGSKDYLRLLPCDGRRPCIEAAEVGLSRGLLEPFEQGRHVVRGTLEPELRARVLAERAKRSQPFRDDKALASWNGLALAAFADAARVFDREDYRRVAVANAGFLLREMQAADGRLLLLQVEL